MQRENRVWYITGIAGLYLALCSFNVIYLATELHQQGAVHLPRDLFPVGGAIAGWLYFFNPRLGHRALIALTVIVLLAIGESDSAALMFHLTVLTVLLLPSLKRPIPTASLVQ